MSLETTVPPQFQPGGIYATPGALKVISESGQDLYDFLDRHLRGDWGDLGDEDRSANDAALLDGSRLVSSYKTETGDKLWIITEAEDDDGHRGATTLLLPDEY